MLADHDGSLDSYGVEVFLDDLADQPRRASATVTVVSASGEERHHRPGRDSAAATRGRAGLLGPAAAGLAATRIGDGPFTYEVRLDLDGTTYVGAGTWPDDEQPEWRRTCRSPGTALPVFAGVRR